MVETGLVMGMIAILSLATIWVMADWLGEKNRTESAALHCNIGIWTNDHGFQGQSLVPIYSTAHLAKSLLRR